jgi:hypothetical protein
MPRGGARVGAGRKPNGERAIRQRVVAMPGIQMPPSWGPPVNQNTSAGVSGSPLKEPPAGFAEPGASFWRIWAPWAIEQGTLIDATVAGFSELCEQFVVKQALWAQLDKVGIASAEGDRILKRYEKIVQRVDASLARFRLTSFGKAIDQTGKKKAEAPNPWAGLARKA